ncbi:MAG: hypothetical protein OXH64_05290 [Rhodospirillaceae bacterium]|nr:hypothetical protein [Rhodospirillaceae bacterium]
MAEQVLIRIDGLDRETGTVNVTVNGTAHAFPLPLDSNYDPLRGVALRDEVIDQAIACHHAARADEARCRPGVCDAAAAELAVLAGEFDVSADYAAYCETMNARPDREARHFKMRTVDGARRTGAPGGDAGRARA